MSWANKGSCFWCGRTEDLNDDEIGNVSVNVCSPDECQRELRRAQQEDRDEREQLARDDAFGRY